MYFSVPGSMVDFVPPQMSPEECDEANHGYTRASWLEQEVMFSDGQ